METNEMYLTEHNLQRIDTISAIKTTFLTPLPDKKYRARAFVDLMLILFSSRT